MSRPGLPSQRWRHLRASLVAGLVALTAAAGCPNPGAGPETRQTDSERGDSDGNASTGSDCDCERPSSFADAVDRVRPAVVNLYAAEADASRETPDDAPRGGVQKLVPERRLVRSLGSGVIVESSGRVVTNHHVVEGADSVRARLLDDRWFEAELVGSDPKTDVALLQLVDAEDLPTAPLGASSDLRVGDWVVAIGNPLGLSSTVTVGIASGIGRSDLPMEAEMQYQDFIQTDASINPGNSGGPLVDAEGNVVGLNTAIRADAQGIGFAIPSTMVERVLPRLERDGAVSRSWLGLYVDPVPSALGRELDLGRPGGVLVTRIVDDSPAGRAGLAEGDVILEVDGEPIEDVDQITWIAGNLPTDQPVEVVVRRGEERERLELTPTTPPDRDAR